jgi:hypothetical protein
MKLVKLQHRSRGKLLHSKESTTVQKLKEVIAQKGVNYNTEAEGSYYSERSEL